MSAGPRRAAERATSRPLRHSRWRNGRAAPSGLRGSDNGWACGGRGRGRGGGCPTGRSGGRCPRAGMTEDARTDRNQNLGGEAGGGAGWVSGPPPPPGPRSVNSGPRRGGGLGGSAEHPPPARVTWGLSRVSRVTAPGGEERSGSVCRGSRARPAQGWCETARVRALGVMGEGGVWASPRGGRSPASPERVDACCRGGAGSGWRALPVRVRGGRLPCLPGCLPGCGAFLKPCSFYPLAYAHSSFHEVRFACK